MRRFLVLLLLMIAVPCYGERVCMSWEDRTSDAYWTNAPAYPGYWNGTAWVSEDYDETQMVNVGVVGSWGVGYRPEKVRITFTGDATTVQFYVHDSNGDEIAGNNKVSSGDEIDIAFAGYDIARIITARNESYQITKIEFLIADAAIVPNYGHTPERRMPWQRRRRQQKHKPFKA